MNIERHLPEAEPGSDIADRVSTGPGEVSVGDCGDRNYSSYI